MRPSVVLLTLALAVSGTGGCQTVESVPLVEQPVPDLVLAADGAVRVGDRSYRLDNRLDVVQLERWLTERREGEDEVHLELAAERGTPAEVVQALVELLGRAGMDDWRLYLAGPRR